MLIVLLLSFSIVTGYATMPTYASYRRSGANASLPYIIGYLMRKFWSWMLRLLGPALLLIFLLNSNLNELYAILINADLWPIIWSLILIFPFLFIKAWRWRVLMHTMDMDMPQLTATALYNVGIYLARLRPAKPVISSRRGISRIVATRLHRLCSA